MIVCTTDNGTFTINPNITYRETLEANFAKLNAWLEANSLDSATDLIRKEGLNVSTAEVDAAIFGKGGQVCVGLHTSLSDSLSPTGNPRKKPITLHETEMQGVYRDDKGNTHVKGLVVSKNITNATLTTTPTKIKDLIKSKLGFGEWVSIKVKEIEVLNG